MTLKQVSVPSFQENLVPKKKHISKCYEIRQSEQVKFINHKYDIWNRGSWPKIKNLGRLSLKIAVRPVLIKLGTQNKLNMLIINILIGNDDLDPKLQICKIWSQNWNFFNFYEIWHAQQMKHANYEWAVINHALTHTHPHPAKKRSHSPTTTYTKPRKGHTHPHLPTPSQKKVTLTHTHPKKVTLTHTHPHPDKKGQAKPKEGHTHPHITEKKNVMCLTHTYKYSLLTILAGVFIFEKDWPVRIFLLNTFEMAFESIVCLFVFNNYLTTYNR